MPIDYLPLILLGAILACAMGALRAKPTLNRRATIRVVCIVGFVIAAGLIFIVYLLPGICLFPKASGGDLNGQIGLGRWYQAGMNTGLFEWPTKAAKWYRKAAEQGNVNAQYQMGIYYHSGSGVRQDDAVAVTWFERAASNGMTEAAQMVTLIRRDNQSK